MLDDTTPHVAVVVQAIRDGEVIATTLSDKRGKYQFINLKPGQYQLRCQVLGGYVYYRATDRALLPTLYDSRAEESEMGEDLADILQVDDGRILTNIDLRFAQFKKGTWKTYTYLDGLAHNWVLAIHRDPGGAIWFGTGGGGVSRYDGKEFVNFTTEDGLASNSVTFIHRARDGILWIGTGDLDREGRGISLYDGKAFTNLTTKDGLADDNVLAFHCDPDGVMWFGTAGGISRYDGHGFINLTTKDGLVDNTVLAIHRDPDGVMWFGTLGGVSRYDGEEFINFTTDDGLVGNLVNAIYRDPNGVLWFGAGWFGGQGGVSLYDGKRFVNFTREDGLAENTVAFIYGDPDGAIWLGLRGGRYKGAVSRYDGKGFVNFTSEDGLLARGWLHCIHRDSDGVMWFAAGAGVSRYDSSEIINFTTKDGLVGNDVRVIHRDPDGILWAGTGSRGISRYDGKEFVNFTRKDGLLNLGVRDIYRDPDGVLWFATAGGGISRYDGREFVNFAQEGGLAHNNVRAIHGDPDGIIWFGTGGGGVYRYDGKTFANLTTEDGLAHNSVWTIHVDPDGVIWFGTWGGGISRYDGKTFTNLTTEDGLPSNDINAIYRALGGVMWFGMLHDGVSRYDGKEFVNFTTKDGLSSNAIHAIYNTPDGAMWFGTEGGGVSWYDGISWSSLDMRDGLAGNDVTSIHQDSDGYLWFATEGGITRYRRSNVPPKVHIASVTTDQTYRDLCAIPAFTPGTRVTIEHSSIDFRTLPEKRQYRCRIREIDSDWRKPTKAISDDFIFDEPGEYTLEVQAIDRDLNYSEPASVKLEVVPDPRNHRIVQLEEHIHQQELAELERVHQELEDARQIQQSLLPDSPPEIEGFEIAGISLPAKEVSGDFYNYLLLGENAGIVLADVTGKSVKAAMVAALTDGMLSEVINSQRELWDSPSNILRRLNIGIHPRLIRGMYTAMSLGIVHVEDKRLLFSNAGMPYPIVKRGNEIWELEVKGMPLGLMNDTEYQDLSLDLEEGDFVAFCSDGVIEAENEAGEMYQTERLLELLQESSPALSAEEMVNLILRDVTAYLGDEEASDDITIVVLRRED